jgi:hypothetical protein
VRDRVKRKGNGRYRVALRGNEQLLVGELIDQLREQLVASTDEPHLKRLFPPAYADDREKDAGYQVLTRDELLEERLAAIDVVESTLGSGADLDEAQLTAWMTTLNSLRLVLGTRLDVDENLPDLEDTDELAPAYAVYDFLGWLVSQAVDVLSTDLPPPGEPDDAG